MWLVTSEHICLLSGMCLLDLCGPHQFESPEHNLLWGFVQLSIMVHTLWYGFQDSHCGKVKLS